LLPEKLILIDSIFDSTQNEDQAQSSQLTKSKIFENFETSFFKSSISLQEEIEDALRVHKRDVIPSETEVSETSSFTNVPFLVKEIFQSGTLKWLLLLTELLSLTIQSKAKQSVESQVNLLIFLRGFKYFN
jgi:hypothetical protein